MHFSPAFAFLVAFVTASFNGVSPAVAETVRGNGVIKTEVRTASGFAGVALALPAKVEVRVGSTESVTLEADDNLLPLIETSVRKGSLQIKPVRSDLNLDSRSIRVVVQARSIEQLEIAGAGSIRSETALRGERLKLSIGGAGSMDLKQVDTGNLEVAIGGSGDVRMSGSARKIAADVAGSGELDTASLVTDEAVIAIAGSGTAQLGVRRMLDVRVVGSGAVSYFGDPAVRRSIVGAGVIRRAGSLPQ